jgi:hypothetical protein
MDSRATEAGAVALLFIGLESTTSVAIRAAFTTRMALAPAGTTIGRAAAAVDRVAAARLFGRSPVDRRW